MRREPNVAATLRCPHIIWLHSVKRLLDVFSVTLQHNLDFLIYTTNQSQQKISLLLLLLIIIMCNITRVRARLQPRLILFHSLPFKSKYFCKIKVMFKQRIISSTPSLCRIVPTTISTIGSSFRTI